MYGHMLKVSGHLSHFMNSIRMTPFNDAYTPLDMDFILDIYNIFSSLGEGARQLKREDGESAVITSVWPGAPDDFRKFWHSTYYSRRILLVNRIWREGGNRTISPHV
jgi:hypothetical protein